MDSLLKRYEETLRNTQPVSVKGVVTKVIGLTIESNGPQASIGELCHLVAPNGQRTLAEVVGFRDERILLMPYDEVTGLTPGTQVEALGESLKVSVGEELLGHILDGLGRPIDSKYGDLKVKYPALRKAPSALERQRIDQHLMVGVRAIDSMLTVGRGQRMGIFAGSGVGKSSLLGMIAQNTEADVNVIALIGERGREVKDFIENNLGAEGLARSVVVVVTSDEPALLRIKAAYVATAIAEYFRDTGKKVLLMMDSLTRFAMAWREVGLAIGEPPTARGYTPKVFAELPRLLERAGTNSQGSITGFYTVLVDGDDFSEPITDAVRGILDGHILLSRSLAEKGHYPAIDVLGSVSRLMPDLVDKEHLQAAQKLRNLIAVYRDAEDLINIGAYKQGTNLEIDEAIKKWPNIQSFLRQEMYDTSSFLESKERLIGI